MTAPSPGRIVLAHQEQPGMRIIRSFPATNIELIAHTLNGQSLTAEVINCLLLATKPQTRLTDRFKQQARMLKRSYLQLS
ncbi:MAG: hypothetical protein ACHQ03_05890 [Candidatus Bathyarchaeia archaeon]